MRAGGLQPLEARGAAGRDRAPRQRKQGGYRVIPVLLPMASRPGEEGLPRFLRRTTWVKFSRTLDDAEAFHNLVCGIRGIAPGPGPGQAILEEECPYRGLNGDGSNPRLWAAWTLSGDPGGLAKPGPGAQQGKDSPGSSQSGVQGIVYELDTLRHKASLVSAELCSVILGSYANKSQTTTTEQCQVATGSVWDDPDSPGARL